jgi:hypothetical protein
MARPEPTSDAVHVAAPEASLHPLYTLRDANEVAAYLQRKPDVIQELWDIANAVSRYFPGSGIVLDVLYDAEEPLTTLCVYIQAGRDAARANAQLDRFDKEWWFEASGDMDMDTCVDIAYR